MGDFFVGALYEIGKCISENKDINNIASGVLSIMAKSLGIQKGMITIFNRKSGEILIHEAYGISEDEKARGKYSLGEGVTGRVVESGKTVVVPKISEEPMFLNRTGSRSSVDDRDISFICVPIQSESETIGTLSASQFFKSERELESDVKILSIIASMIHQAVKLYRTRYEEMAELTEENQRLHDELKEKARPFNMIGHSESMRVLYGLVEKIAQTSTTVLILGESGVGKELVAEALHYLSPRSDKPFIICNSAALPENLIESELFGHEKGSFTGASDKRKGRFEAAADGTIFLDEIGEISLAVQAKLLRVLQQKEFERVGGNKTVKTEARVIAATNRNLEELIKEGRFREDLYYRLNVFPITIPPLRERKADIPALADHFIEKYNSIHSKRVLRVSTTAIDMLMSYHWPGNVRELENCIERAIILNTDGVIHSHHLPPTLQTEKSSNTHIKGSLKQQLEIVEKEIITQALKNSLGNMAMAARELGLTERIMGLRIKKYKIDYTRYRDK